jgi:hypothetical protein
MTAVSIAMSFKTYMMYRPGGGASCFVPLRKFEWKWGASAVLGANGIWSLTVTQVPTVTQGGNYPSHPIWDKAWDNNAQFVP